MFPVLLWASIHDTIDMSTRWIDCDKPLRYKESERRALRFMDVRAELYFGLVSFNKWINPRLQRVNRNIFTPSETNKSRPV